MKNEKVPGFTNEDKRKDPLQIQRKEKTLHKGLIDSQEEYLIDENEEFVNKNDPEKNYFVDVEDLLQEQSLGDQLSSFGIENLFEFLDDFENENISKSWKKNTPEDEKSKNEEEKVPGDFSMQEFRDMEACAKFKFLLEKSGLFDKRRPTFSDGTPMSDEDISQEAKSYKECKEKNDWKNYSEFEINNMKKCAAWDYFYRKIKNNQKYPTDPNGKPMSEEDINTLATEYNELKEKDPETFAKYKVKNGEWIYDNFNWKEKEFNGRKQYQSYRKSEDKKTNQKITIKYIMESTQSDKNIILDPIRKHYFSIKKEFSPKDDLIIRILKLQK